MRRRDHHYYVYIVSSRTRALYCGITNGVARRTEEHRAAAIPGFTADYRCHRLVWFEHYQYVHSALTERNKSNAGLVPRKSSIEETNRSGPLERGVEEKLESLAPPRSG